MSENFILDVAYICLTSGFLDKKIQGLKSIIDMII